MHALPGGLCTLLQCVHFSEALCTLILYEHHLEALCTLILCENLSGALWTLILCVYFSEALCESVSAYCLSLSDRKQRTDRQQAEDAIDKVLEEQQRIDFKPVKKVRSVDSFCPCAID